MATKKKFEDIAPVNQEQTSSVEETVVPTDSPQKTQQRFTKRTLIKLAVVLLVVVVAGFFGYQWYTSPAEQAKRIEAQNKALVKEVSSHLLLNTGETPVIYDIDDPITLSKQQAFFVGSEKGDKLIVYPQSARAVIWSPKRKIIVNVGPITFDELAEEALETSSEENQAPASEVSEEIESAGQ